MIPIACVPHVEGLSLDGELVDDSAHNGDVGGDLVILPEVQAGSGNSANRWSCLAEMTWKNRLLA